MFQFPANPTLDQSFTPTDTPRVDRFIEEHKHIRLEKGYFNGLRESFNALAEFARKLERASARNTKEQSMTLEQEIEAAINRHCAENESNTPDYILACYLIQCLAAFNLATNQRTLHFRNRAQGQDEAMASALGNLGRSTKG